MKKTAWGEVKARFGDATEDGSMPTTMTEIGEILENSLGLEKEDGTKLQLFKEGHILVDELEQEPTLSVVATIIGIPDSIKTVFWEAEKSGIGDKEKFAVKSLVNSKKFAIDFAAVKVPGSETFEAPYASISLSPLYSSTQGWTCQARMTVMRSKSDVLFQFGKVPADGGFAPASAPLGK